MAAQAQRNTKRQPSTAGPVSADALAVIDSVARSIRQPLERDLSKTLHKLLDGLQGTALVAGGSRHIYFLEKSIAEPIVALVDKDEHNSRFTRVLLAQLPYPWSELRKQFLPATLTNFGSPLNPAAARELVEVETIPEKPFRKRFIVLGDVASDALGMLRLRTPCAELVTYALCPIDWMWSPQQVAVGNAHVLQVNGENEYDAWLRSITDPMLHDAFVVREHELQGRARECKHPSPFNAIGLLRAPNPVFVHQDFVHQDGEAPQEAMLIAPCEGGGRAAPPGTSWATLHHLGVKHPVDRAQPVSIAARAAVRDLALGFVAQVRTEGAAAAAARRAKTPVAAPLAREWPRQTAAEGLAAANATRAARAAAAAEAAAQDKDRFALAEQLAIVCLGGMTERWRSRVGETLPQLSVWDRGPWTALHPRWQGAVIAGKVAAFAGDAVRTTIHEGANDQLLSLAWGSKLSANLSAAFTFFKVSTPTTISMWTPSGYFVLPFTIPLLASVPLLTVATAAVLRVAYHEVAEKAHKSAQLRRGALLQEFLRPSTRPLPGSHADVMNQARSVWVVVTRPSEEPLGSEAPLGSVSEGAVLLLEMPDVVTPALDASSNGRALVDLLERSALRIAGIANPRMHKKGDPVAWTVAWMVVKHALAARLEHAAELFEGGGIGGQPDPAGTRSYAFRCAMEAESFPHVDIIGPGEALHNWSCPLATEVHQARPNAKNMAESLARLAARGAAAKGRSTVAR